MANNRRENIRLLQLAMRGKLTPEDLISKEGRISITMLLGPDYLPGETYEQYCERYKLWLESHRKPTGFHQGKKRISVTLNLD